MLRKPVFWVILVVLLALAGGGYYYYTTTLVKKAEATTQVLQTARVSRGNLTISASGTGTLIPASTVNLAFAKSGTLGSVSVQVGDKVKAGQVLGKQNATDALQAQIASDQLNLLTAQQALDALYNSLESDRASAQAAVVTAQKNLTDANYSRDIYGTQRCDPASVTLYYGNLVTAQNTYNQVNSDFNSFASLSESDPRRINAYSRLYSANTALQNAQRTYDYCTGNSDSWTTSNLSAQAAIAQATYNTAKTNLANLKDGPDPTKLSAAKAKLDAAKNSLASDQKSLADLTLYSPVDGVVTAVNYQVGENTGGTFVTIADKFHPMITIYMDETELSNLTVGYDVNVVFDALPEKTFTGKISQISPSLVTQGGVQYLQATVKLDDASAAVVSNLPSGMSAAVEVIGGRATNAILIPVDALRTIGSKEYGVFVVQQDGSLKFTPVTIGLQDLTHVEIKSGLVLGQTVSTGRMVASSTTAIARTTP